MKKFLFSRSAVGLAAVVGTFAALPVGIAAADSPSTACPGEQFSQPFLSWGDDQFFTLAPGESADSFDGTGWTLSGGASIETTTLQDGTMGSVLDLPAGSTAVSPPMCVSTGYPSGRMMTRVVAPPPGQPVPPNGKLPKPKVTFTTSAADGTEHSRDMEVPGTGDWLVSHKVPVAPGNRGPEEVYFTFTVQPDSSELQVYNLYVDPRML